MGDVAIEPTSGNVLGIRALCLDSSQARPGGWVTRPGAPSLLLRCDGLGRGATLQDGTGEVRRWEDPLEGLEWMGKGLGAVGVAGRWVGYLSYDLGRLFEPSSYSRKRDAELPLYAFAFQPDYAQGLLRPPPFTPLPPRSPVDLRANFGAADYLRAVQRVIDYVGAGDVFQVNLSQRFTVPLREDPADIYGRLCKQTPAWYGAYLDFTEFALVCNSPELFLRVMPSSEGRRTVTTRPIKGTRPLAEGEAQALLGSVKDQAELNMIVDLERNDLGRVCEIGSVRVVQPRTIENHPTVYHGSATIEGELRASVGFVDLLRATFPGGSVTGAPKIRAMQIIDELEPEPRGPYCGAIGYLGTGGQLEFNVAIRTLVAHNGVVHLQVGGGIVADSDPQAEYEETLVKARAMISALQLNVDDLRTIHTSPTR